VNDVVDNKNDGHKKMMDFVNVVDNNLKRNKNQQTKKNPTAFVKLK
jgi:hypothetical protein